MKPPDFHELVGTDENGAELERLRRAHDALVAAGPPAELPHRLLEPPAKTWEPEVVVLPRGIPRRRLAASLVLAAALAAATFGVGYIVGNDDGGTTASPSSAKPETTVTLAGGTVPDAVVVVRFYHEDNRGNTEMLVTAEGLPQLSGGDYYILDMTKHGKRVVSCGTFNVGGKNKRTTVRFSVAYNVASYDGLALVRYEAEGHKERTLLRAKLERV